MRWRPVRSTALGLAYAVSFPVVLVAGIIYLLGLTARFAWTRPEPRRTETPCGPLCSYTRRDSCMATTYTCAIARPMFTTRDDPNNCYMFKAVE